jgi:hypothetical protein
MLAARLRLVSAASMLLPAMAAAQQTAVPPLPPD